MYFNSFPAVSRNFPFIHRTLAATHEMAPHYFVSPEMRGQYKPTLQSKQCVDNTTELSTYYYANNILRLTRKKYQYFENWLTLAYFK